MKIDLNSVDRTLFQVEENIILATGTPIYFIHPNPAAVIQWDKSNAHFRSSVWDKNGNLISAGFKKFFEVGENEQYAASPTEINGSIHEKIDGTLLIVSSYDGHQFIRTRGRLEIDNFDQKEINWFKRSLRYFDENLGSPWSHSYLFEWVSSNPNHRQVINYGIQPAFYLVGIINHEDYGLFPQLHLNSLAKSAGFRRPPQFLYTNITELKNDVETWRDKEGVVISSQKDQVQHKLKSKWYRAFHKLINKGSDRENIIDAWIASGYPSYHYFIEKLAYTCSDNTANNLKGEVSIICDAWKETTNIVNGMNEFVNTKLVPLSPAREVENIIQSAYGKTNRADYVLKLYRGQKLVDDDLKKLLFQCIKNR